MDLWRFCVVALVAVVGACSSNDGGGGGGGGPDGQAACFVSNDACAGETICVAGTCEQAFGRVYTIGNVFVQFPTKKADGTDWDALGGAPDPLLPSH